MAEQNRPSSGNKDTSFIRETIRPKKKKYWQSLLKGVLLALLCGCAAGTVFWLLTRFVPEPGAAEKSLAQTETVSGEESGAVDSESLLAELEPQLEEKIESELEQYYSKGDNAAGLAQQIKSAYQSVQYSSMAVLVNTQRSVDWLQGTREQTTESWALILSISGDQVRLLADARELDTNAALSVRFGSREYEDVTVLAQDSVTHMAVLEVLLGEETLPAETWRAAEFGSSYNLQNGTVVLAVGAPLGYVNSLDCGIVSWQQTYQETADSSFNLCYTNMMDQGGSGVLVNLQGQVVGWLTDIGADEADGITAIGISSLTALVERLVDGRAPALLGIVGEEVPAAVQTEQNMPGGLYVTEIQEGSPAMEAGLQYGDIVTMFDDTALMTMSGLQNLLLQADGGQTVTLTVMRLGRDGYSEMTIPVVLGTR